MTGFWESAEAECAWRMAAQPSSARNITVVIPSYPPHVFHLEAQLETWVRYCSDAGIVSFDVITRARDVKAFVQVLAWLLPYLPRLRVRSLEDLIEFQEPEHARAILRERVLPNNKFLIQSAKKLLGCVGAASAWCFAVDSEARLLRPTSLAGLLRGYLVHRPILFNSRWMDASDRSLGNVLRNWRCVSKSDAQLLPGRARTDWWFLVRRQAFACSSYLSPF